MITVFGIKISRNHGIGNFGKIRGTISRPNLCLRGEGAGAKKKNSAMKLGECEMFSVVKKGEI